MDDTGLGKRKPLQQPVKLLPVERLFAVAAVQPPTPVTTRVVEESPQLRIVTSQTVVVVVTAQLPA